MATPTKTRPKKAKAKALKTLVSVVLDETGSMGGIVSDTIGAINTYFTELAKDSPDALVSLMQFSDCFGREPKFRVAFKATKVKDAPKVTGQSYQPRGNTPLYDAIGKAITETDAQNADRYLLVVVTDGQENASTEWRHDGIVDLIKQKEAAGNWTIVYLGANQDAWAVGGALGVSRGNTMTFAATPDGVAMAAAGLAHSHSFYLASNKSTTDSSFADAGQSAKDYMPPNAGSASPQASASKSATPEEEPIW